MKPEPWTVFPLHARVPYEEVNKAFEVMKPGQGRKIILATNVAESSITIPDVTYVIDFCLTKQINADKETNYVSLQLEWADHNSMEQRKGRAGRVSRGKCIRLIEKEFYQRKGYPQISTPELLRAPLDKVLLDTKLLGDFGPPKNLLALAMDPPRLESIHTNIMALKETGALLPTVRGVVMQDDGDLTVLGEILAALPVDIRYGKLIVFGHLFGVLEECVIIAAGISNKSIFSVPFGEKNDRIFE